MLFLNSPSCLENYIISFNGCYPLGTVPSSGYYLENLEGLTLDNVAAVASEVLISATKTIAEKVNFAADIVEKRLKAVLNNRGIKLNSIGNKYGVCSVSGSTDIAAPLLRGIKISKTWLNSPQSRIYVDSVRFKSSIDGNSTVYIKDLLGNILWQQNISVFANDETHVFVKKHFYEDNILILWDTTAVTPYLYNCNENNNCLPCAGESRYLVVTGWNGFASSSNAYLGACIRLDCVDTDIICQFLERLGMAILYQTGVQILREWISPNNRLNLIKTHGGEWANTKIVEWENLSIEALDNEIDNIIQILETDKFCYSCRYRLRMVTMLPS